MPAKNVYHDAVVEALVADGWTITADPLSAVVGPRRLHVDLGAERAALAAERAGERIAVEVQSFVGRSDVESLHLAVGQFAVYRAVLDRLDPGRVLYLAVPDDAYTRVFDDELGRLVVQAVGVKLLVHRVGETGGGGLRWIG
jgi:hypothetical protein